MTARRLSRSAIGLLSIAALTLTTAFWAGFPASFPSDLHAAPPAGKGGGGGDKDEPPPPPPPSYELTLLDLGVSGSFPTGMNEGGDMVGWWSDFVGSYGSFIYFSDTGAIHDLDEFFTPEDQERWFVQPNAINSSRQICGKAHQLVDGVWLWFAVRLTPHFDEQQSVVGYDIEAVSPGSSTGGFTSRASEGFDINEWGDVTGVYRVGDEDFLHAFVYTDEDGFTDIGDLGGGKAEGRAINHFGEVTGFSRLAEGGVQAFLYVPGEGMLDIDVSIDGGGKNGTLAYGLDLNDFATIVGHGPLKHKGSFGHHALRWSEANGTQDLGNLGGDHSSAKAVNAHGEIVGEAHDQDGRWQGFLHTGELGMLELKPLVVNLPEDTDRIVPEDINDAGEIAATIYFTPTIDFPNGTNAAVLLTPIE